MILWMRGFRWDMHGILTSQSIYVYNKTTSMDVRHHTCTYQGSSNKISVHAPCTIFHVVYSSTISNLFLVCIFSYHQCPTARATLIWENHPITTATIEFKSSKKNRQENQNKEEATTPDYPACMQSCHAAADWRHGKNCTCTSL